MNVQTTKQSRGLVRSLNRQAVRDDKSPRVVSKTLAIYEPTVCERCGAVFLRKTWRHDHKLTDELIERSQWGFCPACDQISRQEGQGRLIIRGVTASRREDIQRRLQNAAKRAMKTQPERRIVLTNTADDGGTIDIITTSQKLAHRLAHEVKKLLRGRVTYAWSDDGTLFATWAAERRGRKGGAR